MQDVREAYSLFVDVKRSKEFIEQYEKDFLFNDELAANNGGGHSGGPIEDIQLDSSDFVDFKVMDISN